MSVVKAGKLLESVWKEQKHKNHIMFFLCCQISNLHKRKNDDFNFQRTHLSHVKTFIFVEKVIIFQFVVLVFYSGVFNISQ